jgi:hypothetical protein
MNKPPEIQLHASDVLNWGYLVEIAEKLEGIPRNLTDST